MNSRKNHVKRVAASALAVLTVAAYAAPVANVGGLPAASIIVAKAEADPYAQPGNGVIKIEQANKYIEGIYEVTKGTDNKPVYTKKEFANNNTYILEAGKEYVVRTTAFMNVNGTGTTAKIEKNANADLEAGVYEYKIKPLAAAESFDFIAKTTNVAFAGAETVAVKQNGAAVEAIAAGQTDEGKFTIVEGYPFELTVTPATANAEKMLELTLNDGTIKQQTKEKTTGALTMQAVLAEDAADVAVSWTAYKPILELTQANGVVKATDVNFKNIIKDQVVGNINLRYGHYVEGSANNQFFNNDTNENGAFIISNGHDSDIVAEFAQTDVRVNGIDYRFVKVDAAGVITKLEKLEKIGNEEKWVELEGGNANAKSKGKYRVTLSVIATDNATLTATPFNVTKEFEVVNPALKGISVTEFDIGGEPVPAKAGVYEVDWTGEEITPELHVGDDNQGNQNPAVLTEGTDYFISGATTATDEGTYTITVSFIGEYSSVKDLEVTWKIVNTNKYVERKAAPVENASDFTIGYRQATAGSLKSRIASQLNIVGTDPSEIIITYKKADNTDVENPSEKAGKYVATVTNVTEGDMKKNGTVIPAATINFEITPSVISIEPSAAAADLTYGDKIATEELFMFVDNYTDEDGKPAKEENVKLPVTNEEINVIVKTDEAEPKDPTLTNGALNAGNYKFTVSAAGNTVLASANYTLKDSNEAIPFTVKKRDISEIDFGTILQPLTTKDAENKPINYTKLSKKIIAEAANKNEKNPAKLDDNSRTADGQHADDWFCNDDANLDFDFGGGYVTAKNTLLGKTFEVTLKGIGNNFTGKTKIKWILGGSLIDPAAISYTAEFDVAKPRIMANIDLTKLEGDIAECGFYYANNDKMTAFAAAANEDAAIIDELLNGDKTGAANKYNAHIVTFGKDAVAKAKAGNGLLQAAIANSSVKKNVYAVPYIKYSNGEIAYGELSVNNYYQLVLEAENALEVTKTDVIGDGKNGLTKGKKYVKMHAKRVDKQGYEVLAYGILYNNSDEWVANEQGVQYDFADRCKYYDKWLSVEYKAEKAVKYGDLNEEEIANKMLGVDVYAANTDAAENEGAGDGFGDKHLYAEAYVTIKDAAGNTKTYYSNLADCTYGAYTVKEVVEGVDDPKYPKYNNVNDATNKTQIEFYNAEGKQMKASSGSEELGYYQFAGNQQVEPQP